MITRVKSVSVWNFVPSPRAVGVVLTWALASAAILAYLWVNVTFASVGEAVGGGCASVPVLLFFVAAVRNGLRFTVGWSMGLLLLAGASFLAYGLDGGLGSFLLAGVLALGWMGVLVFWALAYRPELGAMGALVRGASGAVQRVQGKAAGGPGVSIMTVLLVCNLVVSLLGVLV